jgi:hypothetical protein
LVHGDTATEVDLTCPATNSKPGGA